MRVTAFLIGLTIFFTSSILLAQAERSKDEATKDASGATDKLNNAKRARDAANRVLRLRCLSCHNPDSANGGLDITNNNGVLDFISIEGKPSEAKIFQVVINEDISKRMPRGGQLNAKEIGILSKWIESVPVLTSKNQPVVPNVVASDGPPCNILKRLPANVSSSDDLDAKIDDYILSWILHDVRTIGADPKLSQEKGIFRYFSAAHTIPADPTGSTARQQLESLVVALNHLSLQGQLVKLNPVDDAGLIQRLDLRELNWQRPVLKADGDDAVLTPYDLILLEYPYGVLHLESAKGKQVATEFLNQVKQVRPVPYVRADWFTSTALQSPLYEDLLQLPLTVAELEKQLNVDVNKNIAEGIAKRSAVIFSGVSRNNRVIERHPASSYYYRSYDFKTSSFEENILKDPIGLKGLAGGEYIFSLNNGLQGYFVSDAFGNRLPFAVTDIVADDNASDRIVRNGLSCVRCHINGTITTQNILQRDGDLFNSIQTVNSDLASKILTLYGDSNSIGKQLEADSKKFESKVQDLALDFPKDKPSQLTNTTSVSDVSQYFLDGEISRSIASHEFGLLSQEDLNDHNKDLTNSGLASLVDPKMSVQRDTFEDYFDQVSESIFNGAKSISPVDALAKVRFEGRDASALQPKIDFLFESFNLGHYILLDNFLPDRNRRRPFDQLKKSSETTLLLSAFAATPIWIEVFVRRANGQIQASEVGVVKIEEGQRSFRLGIRYSRLTGLVTNQLQEFQKQLAKAGEVFEYGDDSQNAKLAISEGDVIIIYASKERFDRGKVFRANSDSKSQGVVGDRIVHDSLFQINDLLKGNSVGKTAEKLIKKTFVVP